MVFDSETLEIEVAQSIPVPSSGAIIIQGGTNGHEPDPSNSDIQRSGDTNGSGARTFIKFDSVHEDSDIRIAYWNRDGQYIEIPAYDINCAVVVVGGGEESRSMASGIIQLGEHFKALGIEESRSKKYRSSNGDCCNLRTDRETIDIDSEFE